MVYKGRIISFENPLHVYRLESLHVKTKKHLPIVLNKRDGQPDLGRRKCNIYVDTLLVGLISMSSGYPFACRVLISSEPVDRSCSIYTITFIFVL